jgi:hypothetical protein
MAAIKTAPWSGEALRATLDSYRITLEASLYVAGSTTAYPLSLVDASVDYSGRRSPRVHADLTGAWPTAQTRSLMDPRMGLEVEIRAGYEFLGSGTQDTQTLCRLRVQTATKDYREKTIAISADSDEVIAIGYPIETADSLGTSNGVVTAIQNLIEDAFVGETLTWSIGENVAKGVTFDDTQELTPGQDRWAFIQDWADSIGAVVYHDGLGVWHIENADPTPSAFTVANLRTGARGTVTRLRTEESLEGYANRAAAVYEYTVGTTSYRKTAIASTGLTPRQMVTDIKRFKPHNSGEVARRMLMRGLRRGHTVEVSAASYLWVRPGYTATVELPDGGQERLLVETVDFDLAAGEMTLTGQNADGAPFSEITTTLTTTTL